LQAPDVGRANRDHIEDAERSARARHQVAGRRMANRARPPTATGKAVADVVVIVKITVFSKPIDQHSLLPRPGVAAPDLLAGLTPARDTGDLQLPVALDRDR
jgi:hypothetical protein